jgi:hypothetical protein
MWDHLRDWAQIAPLLTPVVALIAVIFAWLQLRLNRANQRETTAKATFREFLKICVQNPDLAYGKSSPDKQNEYEWFVAYFLWATEEILEYSHKDWEANLRLHMTYHKDFLRNNQRFHIEDFPTYSTAVQAPIVSVVGPISTSRQA